ncbi:4-hydroxy-2-oxoheptanedioate aldolase [Bauldia litoralis]|uniref:4-hydroxy-2-oxoheptanedioate aldolase n=2 Tax=Bauldia litoralis TaxID=665467 RepID=A0A1G6DIQ6_9HYPH|nr:4-hydroxy-2-oxoheptanedioate aldolase [Bauldia litoralis]
MMGKPTLAARLRAGDSIYSGWIATPEPLIAETAARQAFDCVCVDMQHGLHDPVSVMRSIGGIVHAGKPAGVRVPVGDFAMASRALDMGAEAVIAPMINSVADARALVAATKYPSLGERSWGPARALSLQGIPDAATQLATANDATLAFAMVETKQALDLLDEILAVEGIDGVFMGPSDLSLTLSGGKEVAPAADWMDEPIRRIAARARAHGKIACAFGADPVRARYFTDVGYHFVALGPDAIYLASGIRTMLEGLR